jgi:hypothetical protein
MRFELLRNPHDHFGSVQVARAQAVPASYLHCEHLSSTSTIVVPSVVPAFSIVISVASFVKRATPPAIPASFPVIPAQAGIHRGKRSAPPTRIDLPDCP